MTVAKLLKIVAGKKRLRKNGCSTFSSSSLPLSSTFHSPFLLPLLSEKPQFLYSAPCVLETGKFSTTKKKRKVMLFSKKFLFLVKMGFKNNKTLTLSYFSPPLHFFYFNFLGKQYKYANFLKMNFPRVFFWFFFFLKLPLLRKGSGDKRNLTFSCVSFLIYYWIFSLNRFYSALDSKLITLFYCVVCVYFMLYFLLHFVWPLACIFLLRFLTSIVLTSIEVLCVKTFTNQNFWNFYLHCSKSFLKPSLITSLKICLFHFSPCLVFVKKKFTTSKDFWLMKSSLQRFLFSFLLVFSSLPFLYSLLPFYFIMLPVFSLLSVYFGQKGKFTVVI